MNQRDCKKCVYYGGKRKGKVFCLNDKMCIRDSHRGLRIFREYSIVGGNAYRRIIYHGAVVHSDNDGCLLYTSRCV